MSFSFWCLLQWNPKEKTKNPTPVLSAELQEAQRKEIWGTLHSLAIRPPGVQHLDSNNDQISPRGGMFESTDFENQDWNASFACHSLAL